MVRLFSSVLLFLCALVQNTAALSQRVYVEDSLQSQLYDIAIHDSGFLVLGVKTNDPPSMGKVFSGQSKFNLINFVAVIDSNGNKLKQADLTELPQTTILRSMLVTDKLILLAGTTFDYSSRMSCIVALNHNMEIQWTFDNFSGELYKIAAISNTEFVICGTTNTQAVLIGISDKGVPFLYQKYAASDDWDWQEGFDILVRNKKLFIAGSVPDESQENFGLFCTNLQGEKLFEKTYSTKRSDATIIRQHGTDLLLAGSYDSYDDIGFLVKITETGDTLFSTKFEGIELDVNSVREASDSLIKLKWGKEYGSVPKDLLVLPNDEILILCEVNYYVGNPYGYSAERIRTMGIYHFSAAGKLLRKSICKTEGKFSPQHLLLRGTNELIILCNEGQERPGALFNTAFLQKITLEQLFDE